MAPRTVYGNLVDGFQYLDIFDESFSDTALLGIIPCSAVGQNSIALTPLAAAFPPLITSYTNYLTFSFVAQSTSTNTVTANISGIGVKNVYLISSSVITQANANDILASALYLLSYVSTLNSNAGGFFLTNAGSGGGGGVTLPALPFNSFQFNNAGSFGGIPASLYAAPNITLGADDVLGGSTGGNVTINSGHSVSGPGGAATMGAGDSSSGAGGVVSVTGGNGGTSGGSASLNAGNGTSVAGGAVIINAGTSVSGSGGIITLSGGNSSASQGGDVVVNIGTGTPSGNLKLVTLPTSDPAITNTVWSSGGILILSGHTVPSVPSAANPTATAGPVAVNGSAATFMRSDGAPAIQKASASQFGIVEVDNVTITAASGVISSVPSAGANPTATAGPNAVNGAATTFMRSDGAPAIQLATSGQLGLCQVDGTSITVSAGIISSHVVAAPVYVSGNWYTPQGVNCAQSVGASTANNIFGFFGYVTQAVTIKSLGGRAQAGTSGGKTQFAVYSLSGNTLTLVDSTGDITTTGGGAISGAVVNTTDILVPGVNYFFAMNTNNSSIALVGWTTGNNNSSALVGSATLGNVIATNGMTGKTISQSYGTWPSITVTSMSDIIVNGNAPGVAFQVN